MKDLLSFETMLTPKLISFLYRILLAAALIYGLHTMKGGYEGFSFSSLLMGLAYMIGGALSARVWCELMIVVFKINEALQTIKNK